MKRLMKKMALPLAGLLTATLFFTACKKNNTDYVRQPAAGLMAFNLAVDKPAVGFTLSGNNLNGAVLNYTNYTGAYLPIYLGDREVRSFDYNTGATIATTTASFADSNYYSAFLLGANGSYRNVVVNDNLNSLTANAGKAWVRYINAIPDSATATTVVVGESSINGVAPYATVSTFAQVAAGPVATTVSNGGTIAASRTITLEENKVYTILFVGQPNQTDSAKAVQVKYIVNGTVTP
ncbi:MAG: DUF4397 domain-containing protein [Ferruginibacter sp.]